MLRRPEFGFDAVEVDALLSFLEASAGHVTAKPLTAKLPDVDDLPFLEVATTAEVAFLVTRNLRHFPKANAGNVNVINASAYLAKRVSL